MRRALGMIRRAARRPLVSYLRHPTVHDVFVVGTMHVGRRSREEVAEVIEQVRPGCILVELCEGRARALEKRRTAKPPNPMGRVFEGAVEQALDRFLAIFLPRFGMHAASAPAFRRAIVAAVGVAKDAGGDMLTAIQSARDLDIRLVPADLPIETTQRAIAKALLSQPFGSADATQLEQGLGTLADQIRDLLADSLVGATNVDDALERFLERVDRDAIRSWIRTFDQLFPKCAQALIHDRDAHMADEIRLAAASNTVVAVVGLAHLDGIERRFLERANNLALGEG